MHHKTFVSLKNNQQLRDHQQKRVHPGPDYPLGKVGKCLGPTKVRGPKNQ